MSFTDLASSAPDRTIAPATSDLARTIREAIVTGSYAPNQRLIEADLATTYSASRSAIRTALVELANDGLVDRLPNRGSRVRAITVKEAIEILEVRIGLESLCAAKAAERISEDEAQDLLAIREQLLTTAAAGDLIGYSQANQQLDSSIREMSGHATAVSIIEKLRAQSVRHQFRLSFQTGRAAVSAPEHVAIIDAVVRRDPEAAMEATRQHLRSVIEAVRQLD